MANIATALELSFSRLKLVTLEHKKEGVTIVNFDTENVVKGGTLEETLQNVNLTVETLVKRTKIKGRFGVTFPSHAIFTRQVKMLPQPDEKLYETISFEINEYLPFPANEAVWNYHKVKRQYNPGEEYDIVVIAAKYEVMEQVERILGNLIYRVDVLQFAPLALYSYLRFEFADNKETFLVLDIGETNNDMVIVEEGKFWHRSLPLAGKDITKAIVTKLKVSEEEANEMKRGGLTPQLQEAIGPFIKNLSTEISRSINFYKYTSKKAVINEIKLCGSASKLNNFPKLLQQITLIKTSLLDVPQTIFIHPAIEQTIMEELPSLYPAIGLALQTANLSEISMDFSPHYVIEYKKFSKKKPLAGVGLLLLIIAVVISFFTLSGKNEQLEQQVQQMSQVIKQNNQWLENYKKDKAEINRLALIDYIANNIYKKRDKILYILDALVYAVKLYNATKTSEEKIYLIGFDYTTEISNKSLERSDSQSKSPKEGEKKEQATVKPANISINPYINSRTELYNLSILLATKSSIIADFSDTIIKMISQQSKQPFVEKMIELSNFNQKKIDEKSSITVKCSTIKKEGTTEHKRCAIPSAGECREDSQGFVIFRCENIILLDSDLEELVKIIEESNLKEKKQ